MPIIKVEKNYSLINTTIKEEKDKINETNKNKNEKNNIKISNNLINKYRKNNYYKINEFNRINKEGKLIVEIPKISSDNPKITVIIPLFNAQKKLKSTIRSIQNQNFKDLEIILVDDCSTDKTIEIVNNLKQEDPRIKLIKNKENRGTLYTRSIGALNAKGKYIMPIDNDDLFMKDIFNICYEEAENNNIDIIEFSGCNKPYYSFFFYYCNICYFLNFKEDGVIIRQPELSNFIYQKQNNIEYKLIDALLWGKCIKTNIYIKSLKMIGEETYSKNVCWSEDRIVNFALFRNANSFKFIKIYGITHIYYPDTVGRKWEKEQKKRIFHDELINAMSIYNITKNTKDEVFAAYEFKRNWGYSSTALTEENKILAKNLYNKLINSTFISENYKKLLINITNNMLN